MLYVFYSIHMIAYSGGAPIQSSLRRPSGNNKAQRVAIFHWQYWTAKKAMAFANIVAFICVISLVSDSVALNAIFAKSLVDSNSAKKISLRFKKSFKNPKLSGTWRKVILGISGKTWRGKTATDRHDRQTRISHQGTAVRASIDLPIRNRKTETGMKRIWRILNL